MHPYRHILVPIDFSPDSRQALDTGLCLAAGGGTVAVLHVVPAPAYVGELYVPALDGLSLADYQRREAGVELAAFLETVTVPPDVTLQRTVAIGSPAGEILDRIAKGGVDLVVMGAQGHGAVAHFLRGSVVDRVVHQATCAVLVVRRPA